VVVWVSFRAFVCLVGREVPPLFLLLLLLVLEGEGMR
jgi:hypothetical protein